MSRKRSSKQKNPQQGRSGNPQIRAVEDREAQERAAAGEENLLDDLIDAVGEAMATSNAMAVVGLASTFTLANSDEIADAQDAEFDDEFDEDDEEHVDFAETLRAVATFGEPETNVLAWAVAELQSDAILRSEVQGQLKAATLPAWITEMGNLTVTASTLAMDAVGETGYVVMTGAWADQVITLLVFLGDLVAVDAGFEATGHDDLVAQIRQAHADEPGWEFQALEPAAARAWVDLGLALSDVHHNEMENENWPFETALLDWLLRKVPTGVAGPTEAPWNDTLEEQVLNDFFAAESTRTPDTEDYRLVVSALASASATMVNLDPLKIGPSKAVSLLLYRMPSQGDVLAAAGARLPEILVEFIRFANQRSGVPEELTQIAIEETEGAAPRYLEMLAQSRGRR